MVGEIVLAGLVFIFNLLGISSAVSASFALSFIVLVAYIAFSGVARRVNATLFVIIVVSTINVILNGASYSAATLNFDYFKKLIFFITSIVYFELATRVEVHDKAKIIVKYIIYFLGIFLVIDYFVLGNHKMLGRYLTMGFTNPNFTAMWLLQLFLFYIYYIAASKAKIEKILCISVSVLCLYLITLTLNRAALFILPIYILLAVLGMVRKKYQLNKHFIFVVLLVPIFVYVFYHLIISNQHINQMFNFIVSEGKGLDSRSRVWDFATSKLFAGGWLIGDYAGISDGTGASQMHNTHLDILISYGILPFTLFLKLLYSICRRVNDTNETFIQYLAYIGFMLMLLFGTFEAGLFAGCTGLNYLTGTLIVLARNREEKVLWKEE